MASHNVTRLWLREEVRPNERRTPLTPEDAKILLDKGFRITVERSTQRIFPIEQYESIGCEIVDAHAWTKITPVDEMQRGETIFILGLKDLPEADKSYQGTTIPRELSQKHIFFAHCYKGQSNWREILSRFAALSGGELLDLEFLQYDNGRRIAAFGNAAGFAGVALGFLQWIAQKKGLAQIPPSLVKPYESKSALIECIRQELANLSGKAPRVLVLGALGRCGRGSVELVNAVGVDCIEWDLEETRGGGPFPQLLEDCDILVNDIYLAADSDSPPFVTMDMIKKADADNKRRMSVFVDVSCDVGNPRNPFPLVDDVTTFERPSERLVQQQGDIKPLDVVAIDHLPTLIPSESASDFSTLLVQHLQHLGNVDFTVNSSTVGDVTIDDSTTEFQRVWLRARVLYAQKVRELK